MKKFLCSISAFTFISFSLIGTTFAISGTEYTVSEAEMTITIPNEYFVFTKDTPENYPGFSYFGFDKPMVDAMLDSQDICLNACNKDGSDEITINVSDIDYYDDLNSCSTNEINQIIEAVKKKYNTSNTIYKSHSIYQHNQAKFIVFHSRVLAEDGKSYTYNIQYVTIYNQKNIIITLHAFNTNNLNNSTDLNFKGIANSIVFESKPQSFFSNSSNYTLPNILFSILLTIFIYSLPIIIYRYAILKAPVKTKKAKKITIIYAIFAFIVMSVITMLLNASVAGIPPLMFWSFINHKILTSGKQTLEKEEVIIPEKAQNNIENILPEKDKKIFCRNCGTELNTDSNFCRKCGTQR